MNKKHGLFGRLAGLLLIAALCLSPISVVGIGETGFFEDFKLVFENHRNFASNEQEVEIKLVENIYTDVRARDASESPWYEAVVAGGAGFSPLLTEEIKSKNGFHIYIKLNHLKGKQIAINWAGEADDDLNQSLAQFITDNNNTDTLYNLDGDSMKEASQKFAQLSSHLQGLYTEFNRIKNQAQEAGGTIVIKDGEEEVGQLTEAEIHIVMGDMLTKLLKDLNGFIFSGKDTWEANFNTLLDSENKKLIGVLFGREMADALAQEDVNATIKNYLTSSRALQGAVEAQVELFSGTPAAATEALYTMAATIADGVLEEPVMLDVKNALNKMGWSAQNFVKVNKHIGDAVDTEYKTRIINLNMIFGQNIGIFKDGVLSDIPVQVDSKTLDETEYSIKMYKSNSSFTASVINVVNSFIYNDDGSVNRNVSTKNDLGELEFIIENHETGEFILKLYRYGGPNDVFGYLNQYEIEIDDTSIPVEGIRISEGSNISVREGSNRQLNARFTPTNASNQSVTWKSSNTSVATVSSSGLVSGKKRGTANITVESVDGNYMASIRVSVTARDGGLGGSSSGSGYANTGAGGIVSINGLRVSMDKGAVAAQVNLSAAMVTGYQVPQNLTPASQTFSVTYSPNVPLLKPIDIMMDLDSYNSSKSYYIYRYDSGLGQWTPLANSTLSADRSSISATTDKAGVFAVFAVDVVFLDLVGHWSEADIMYLFNKDMVSGYSLTEFRPDGQITRAEFATIVCRMTGIKAGGSVIYPDAEGHWAREYIAAATENGYMVGYDDGNFNPDIGITREQIIAVLIRAKYFDKNLVNTGESVQVDNLIEKIVEQHPQLDPAALEVNFADFEETSDWAKDYIKMAIITNAVSGYSDNTIRPLILGTRAEGIVLAMRVIGI